MMFIRGRALSVAALVSGLAVAGCPREQPREPDPTFVAGRIVTLQTEAPLHPGPQPAMRLVPLRNPFEGSRAARDAGERLWGWYNCAGCHGAVGGGGISHPIRDGQFVYGMDPASIYQSIAQGRPNGMPAFGGMVPEQQIWQLVTYIQAIGRGEVEADWQEAGIRTAEVEPGMPVVRR